MRVAFQIPGKPYAKKRPRFSRKIGRAFDPAENAAFEGSVANIALRHFAAPFEGPVSLSVTATFAPPQSWSRRKREASIGMPHTQKPDLDNLAKAICDGLNRIAFVDDSQISRLLVAKLWGLSESTEVVVEDVAHQMTTIGGLFA